MAKGTALEGIDTTVFEGKMPWDERARRISKTFPSTVNLDYDKVFRIDPAVMGRVIADMQKMEAQSTGRPGKRPAVSKEDAALYLTQYENNDYTIHKFSEAFKFLKGTKSIRGMAAKCGLTATMVQRLLDGKADPTAEVMEQIARAFKKHPSFFVEYRVQYVVGMMAMRMEAIPESSIVPYLKLRGDAEKRWK